MQIKIGKSGNPRCPWEIRWKKDGKTYRKRFKNKGDAELYIVEWQGENFLPEAYQFSPTERVILKEIRDICANAKFPLSRVIEIVRKEVEKKASYGYDWENASGKYVENVELRGARDATLRFYKAQLKLFAARENVKDIAEITPERAESYLARIPSPEHAKRALRAFYNFCVDKKWVAENPFTAAKVPRTLKEIKPPEVLSVPDTQRILETIPAEWQPAAAIMAFAGVRPAEIAPVANAPVLKIGNIDFEAKRITIPAEVSKVRRTRILTDLPDNLWAWIAPLRNLPAERNIAPASYEVWRRVKDNSGVKLPQDCLRHSFASYGYHALGAEHTVEILGHIGGFGVFARHYKGLSDKQSANAYFKIFPAKA